MSLLTHIYLFKGNIKYLKKLFISELIDELEREILNILSINSRLSITEIARKTNSSKATISRKIKKLEEEGIIQGYVTIIDDQANGIGCRGILTAKLGGEQDEKQILEKLRSMPQVCTLFLTLGKYDLFLMASVNDTAHFYGLVEEIRAIEGIAQIETTTIVSRIKLLNKNLTE